MEREILDNALKNLQDAIPLTAKWDPNGPLDGKLKIIYNEHAFCLTIEIKKEIRRHHIDQILKSYHANDHLMVVAGRIPPEVKKELRELRIAYLEANGNVYLNLQDIILFIDTNKTGPVKKETGNRAFTKTGLKVLFQFLLDKELVNRPQREIAEITGVGLGNVPQIINGLKETGFLVQLKKKKYAWLDREELLSRWITAFETTLRPAILRATYRMKVPWQQIGLNNEVTVWGGEPAADLLTNLLRPEKFIVYTKETQTDIIKNYKFLPEENGELTVFDMFWKQDPNMVTAPPLLVYVELLIEGGKRNKETADKIFNEYIKPKL